MSDAAAPASPAPRGTPDARQRLSERFEELAGDLFALQINTIIKPSMTASPWPGVGHGLLDIASEYEGTLLAIEGLLRARDPGNRKLAELEQSRAASQVVDNVASFRRFDELRERAKALCPEVQRAVGSKDEDGAVQRAVWMITRIRENCDQLKGMFVVEPGTELLPEITRANANANANLVRLDHRGVLRKIWEIGTEEVVMQTVIHLDGDVVMRLQPEFASESGRELLQIHNATVQVAVSFWKVVIDMIGSTLKWFGRT